MATTSVYPDSVSKNETTYLSTYSTPSNPNTELLIEPSKSFRPGRALQIETRGIGIFLWPRGSKDLNTPILASDGTAVYLSSRPKLRSSNCILSSAATGEVLASTTYPAMPGRKPFVTLGPGSTGDGEKDDEGRTEDIEVKSKGFTTRTRLFESRKWGKFQWRYGNSEEKKNAGVHSLLILEKLSGITNDTDNGHNNGIIRIAELLRSDETRSKGSRKSSAGNGGKLVLDERAAQEVDEVLVVATCLLMLKKEIDRRRAMQYTAVTTGGVGGGGGD